MARLADTPRQDTWAAKAAPDCLDTSRLDTSVAKAALDIVEFQGLDTSAVRARRARHKADTSVGKARRARHRADTPVDRRVAERRAPVSSPALASEMETWMTPPVSQWQAGATARHNTRSWSLLDQRLHVRTSRKFSSHSSWF